MTWHLQNSDNFVGHNSDRIPSGNGLVGAHYFLRFIADTEPPAYVSVATPGRGGGGGSRFFGRGWGVLYVDE